MSEVEKKEEVVEKKEEVVEKKEESVVAPAETTTEEKKEEAVETAEDSEPNVDFGVRLKLEETKISNNEEDEEVVYDERSRLFRFDTTETPQWKERGIGNVRFLKDKKTGKVRIVMRREKVHKVCLNHFVDPNLSLEPMQGSDRAWTWKCPLDFSDEEFPNGVPELFAIRFGSSETANKFKSTFDQYKAENKEILSK
ncbi:hypothetical protein DICPUDRAFT_153519 [Dictyostelium purpureum]|uniref:RanBD1 domain-containing protein n=1 Tax=Dictyostelium purpureum TaxID=5786 RepID=F0ZP45_DICPU|nr:uncharacterized protein DICPUDRAFT_153519 [Dictyostelium purpureum]EGC34308.1 hypothetical protein DICPUDRAFT_153519 [Dictyostelium purpureum]|eukprot:XP_003289190.1 hypothetical protein DICPUDRAFT_153519 [Dictyostelium purpureum]